MSPEGPNNDDRRMLVASDGRPDTTLALPSDFQKRFLQKVMAGPDVSEERYFNAELPLEIVTR